MIRLDYLDFDPLSDYVSPLHQGVHLIDLYSLLWTFIFLVGWWLPIVLTYSGNSLISWRGVIPEGVCNIPPLELILEDNLGVYPWSMLPFQGTNIYLYY